MRSAKIAIAGRSLSMICRESFAVNTSSIGRKRLFAIRFLFSNLFPCFSVMLPVPAF